MYTFCDSTACVGVSELQADDDGGKLYELAHTKNGGARFTEAELTEFATGWLREHPAAPAEPAAAEG